MARIRMAKVGGGMSTISASSTTMEGYSSPSIHRRGGVDFDVNNHSNDFRKKHVLNAQALEKSKREENLYCRVLTWIMETGQTVAPHVITQYFSCIEQLVKLMGFEFTKNSLLSIVMYADRYILNAGRISTEQLFRLLLTSTIVSLKFWEDFGVNLDLCSFIFGVSKIQIALMEKHFLRTIDYELTLNEEELERFERSCHLERLKSYRMMMIPIEIVASINPSPMQCMSTHSMFVSSVC